MSTEQVHHWFGCLYEQEMVMVIVIVENRKEKRVIKAVQVRTHFRHLEIQQMSCIIDSTVNLLA